MHCAPCLHHTHTVFFVCYAHGNTKEYSWEIKPGPRGDTVQVYTIKQVPTCPSENGPCASSVDNQTEDWTQLSISVWWGGWRGKMEAVEKKCIGLWKPKTLRIICIINTSLICHSHMIGFLYRTLWSCAGSGHSATVAVNGLILKMEPLNLVADIKSKIESY